MKTIFLIMLLSITAAAQFTQVSATVTDPNSLPYANGTVVAKLVLPGGTSPTLNGLAYTPPSQPVGLNSAGFFLMQIADNNVLLPAATQWSFTVCSAAGTVQPAGGRGPVCFNAGPITITGASQSITATLNAAALALTISTGGAAINPTNNVIPRRLNATTFADSALTDNGTTVTSSESISVPAGTAAVPGLQIPDTSRGLTSLAANSLSISLNTGENYRFTAGQGFTTLTGLVIGFGASLGVGPDIAFSRDVAGQMSLGNGTNGDRTGFLRLRHVNQGATADFAGTCAMAAGTTCTITLSAAYTSTPICIVTVQSATLTGGVAGCTVSGTTVTITAATANSLTWGALLAGNPN